MSYKFRIKYNGTTFIDNLDLSSTWTKTLPVNGKYSNGNIEIESYFPTITLALDSSTWQFFKWNCASSTGGSSGSPSPTGSFLPLTCSMTKSAKSYAEFACGFCTLQTYDLTDYDTLTLVTNSAQFANNAFNLAFGFSDSLISTTTNCQVGDSIFADKTYSWLPNNITQGKQLTVGSSISTAIDISSITGSWYLVFGCGVNNISNANSGSGTATVTSVIIT